MSALLGICEAAFRRGHLLVAAKRGFGTVDLAEIDLSSEVGAPLNKFDSKEADSPEHMAVVRETACEQGLFYRDRMKSMIDRCAGEFIIYRTAS